MIPKPDCMEESLSLVREYGLGFEYNDFMFLAVLDDSERVRTLTAKYLS